MCSRIAAAAASAIAALAWPSLADDARDLRAWLQDCQAIIPRVQPYLAATDGRRIAGQMANDFARSCVQWAQSRDRNAHAQTKVNHDLATSIAHDLGRYAAPPLARWVADCQHIQDAANQILRLKPLDHMGQKNDAVMQAINHARDCLSAARSNVPDILTKTQGHHDAAQASWIQVRQSQGPLFQFGTTFMFQGEEGKVWAHTDCLTTGPRPLVIFLHGSNNSPHWLHPALDETWPPIAYAANKDNYKKDKRYQNTTDKTWMVHVGKLAQKMIDEGVLAPLVIAAPTNFVDDGQPWKNLNLKALVDAIAQTAKASGVQIDLDQVAVVGHSAAGGYPHNGLDKIADDRGAFAGHQLRMFGMADSAIEMAATYAGALASNKRTAVYALHKMNGGFSSTGGNDTGTNINVGRAFGATHEMKSGFVVHENRADMVSALDNQGASPLRMAIKIDVNKISSYRAAWTTAGGYREPTDHHAEPHNDMVPLFAWYALPRFFPGQWTWAATK
jgi:hypothetical protein